MKDYIDLVACKHEGSNKVYLFRAPGFLRLEPGTDVIVETKNGDKTATVISSMTVENDENDSEVKFAVSTLNATWPLTKVKSKVRVVDIIYDDEDDVVEETNESIETESEEN